MTVKTSLVVVPLALTILLGYAQASPETQELPSGAFVPQMPKVGDTVGSSNGMRCRIQTVQREWVQCNDSAWLNLYTGHHYTVYPAEP